MRTADFSAAPRMAQAGVMLTAGHRFASVREVARAAPAWRRVLLDVRRSPGYAGHRVYVEPPRTLGLVAWFDSVDAVTQLLGASAHAWFFDPDTGGDRESGEGRRGFVRLFAADASGYSNGVWRAEAPVMGLEGRFTPLSTETQAPTVRRPRRGDTASPGQAEP